MSFLVTAAVIGGASTLYGVGKGIAQDAKANKIDAANQRPNYVIPDEYTKNVELARQLAQVGLPQQQYNNQQNAVLRNQAAGIQTLGRSANPASGVAAVVRASNDANNTLNAQDAAARQQNQRFYIGQNGILGQQKLAQQQYNKFDKYTEQFNKAAALRGAANQNIQNGINGASSMAMGLASIDNGDDSNNATKTATDTNPWPAAYNQYTGGNRAADPIVGNPPQFKGFGYGTLASGYTPTGLPYYTNWQQF